MNAYTILAQSRPGNTSAISVYSPPASTRAEILNIIVCNTTSASHDFRIFLDADGTTYNETTALFWDIPVPGESTLQIGAGWWMNKSSGNLAVRTDTASAFTFTVFGAEDNV